MKNTNHRRKLWIGAFAALTVTAVGYGVTASNTVGETKAGDGYGTVSGYTIEGSSVHYTLRSDPGKVAEVKFSLNEAPKPGSSVKVQLGENGDWFDCSNTSADVVCDTSDINKDARVAPAAQLRIIVAQ